MELDPDFHAVAAQLNSRLVRCEQLTGGSSAHVWRLDLRGPDDQAQAVVLRQHRRTGLKAHASAVAAKEHEILRLLRRYDMRVAEPLLVDAAEGWLVTSYVTGSPDVAADQLDPMLDQMADFLIRLHRIETHSLTMAELGEIMDPIRTLARCLPDSDAGRLLGSLLDKGKIELHHNRAVLIHGDYWPGNMLWHRGQLAAVIDWEDSCLGDPLADLACTRVELLCRYGERAMIGFTDRYLAGNSTLDVQSLPVWEVFVSATALDSMHSWAWSSPAAEARQRTVTTAFFERAVAELSTR